MKVKVTKCRSDHYWYADRIGEIFDTIGENVRDDYIIFDKKVQGGCAIEKGDCEVVSESEFIKVDKDTTLGEVSKAAKYGNLIITEDGMNYNVNNSSDIMGYVRRLNTGSFKIKNPNYEGKVVGKYLEIKTVEEIKKLVSNPDNVYYRPHSYVKNTTEHAKWFVGKGLVLLKHFKDGPIYILNPNYKEPKPVSIYDVAKELGTNIETSYDFNTNSYTAYLRNTYIIRNGDNYKVECTSKVSYEKLMLKLCNIVMGRELFLSNESGINYYTVPNKVTWE